MNPRDKALADLLDELAAYVLPPQADSWDDRRAQDEQRHRAIRVQVLLRSAATTLRDPKARSKYLSPAELFDCTQQQVREYAAEPLPYEPYQPDTADLPEAGTE